MAVDKGNLKNVIKIKEADYNTILNAYPASATISIEGVSTSVTFDPAALYLIDKTTPDLPATPSTISSAQVPILGTNGAISWQNKWETPDLYCHNFSAYFDNGTYDGQIAIQLWLPDQGTITSFSSLASILYQYFSRFQGTAVFTASGFIKSSQYNYIITGIIPYSSTSIQIRCVSMTSSSTNTVTIDSSATTQNIYDFVYGKAYEYTGD